MPRLRAPDSAFPVERQRQLALDATPTVLVNVFTLDTADEQEFLKACANDAGFMKRRPGFVSARFRWVIGDSPTCMNHAVWESIAAFRAAFNIPDFRAAVSCCPSSASPHLFQKVAAPDIRVAQPHG
jgi:heme-degrading monooxygenase HmoA